MQWNMRYPGASNWDFYTMPTSFFHFVQPPLPRLIFIVLIKWLTGQFLSHCEFWQNSIVIPALISVNVYLMKLEISRSCLPRLFLLSWTWRHGNCWRGMVPAHWAGWWLPYQLTVQEVKGQRLLWCPWLDMEQVALSLVETFPGTGPSLLMFSWMPYPDVWIGGYMAPPKIDPISVVHRMV